MTQEEILCFAYFYAKHQLKKNGENTQKTKYFKKKLNELSKQLEQLGMKSEQTEPLPCKVGDTIFRTNLVNDELEVKKGIITYMRYFSDVHETEAEIQYEDGYTGYLHFNDFFNNFSAHTSLDEACQRVYEYHRKKTAQKMICVFIEENFEDGADTFTDFDWLDDFTLRVTEREGGKRIISYDYNANTITIV